MMSKKVMFITQSAVIAAIYVVLILLFQPFSFGEIQVRVAEALTVLPFFTPAAIPGVTIGCLIGNLIGGNVMDMIFGTLATLIGAVVSYAVRKNQYLVPLPPIVSNALIIPWVLKYAYELPFSIPFLMLTVSIGEVLSCGILGLVLLTALKSCRGINWTPWKTNTAQ
ncbi:MAG TPA: QueT transporter family protein [Candidatus Caccomorpha excrementavium]|nr:QueT transporter family protein [Candidatus Caccomorpha excrementavium]